MKEKISIKNKNYQEDKGIFLTNDFTKELNEEVLEIKDDNEITDELRNKYSYIILFKTIKFINVNNSNIDVEYVFRIVLDIKSYELIDQVCLTHLLMSDLPVGLDKDMNKIDSKNISVMFQDPYNLFNTDDSLVFEFNNGLQVSYIIEEYLDDNIIIQNEDMIDSVGTQLSLSNDIDFNNERYLTDEEISNGEFTKLLDVYKYITTERQIFTTNNLVYILGIKYHALDNVVSMFIYCNILDTDEVINLVDLEYTKKKRKESGDLTTIYFKDPFNMFLPGDRVEVVISENTKVKFIVINDEQEDYGIVEDNNVKNFLKDFFK